jgi:hypothetical protein
MLILKKNQTILALFIASHFSNLALNELTVFALTIFTRQLVPPPARSICKKNAL